MIAMDLLHPILLGIAIPLYVAVFCLILAAATAALSFLVNDTYAIGNNERKRLYPLTTSRVFQWVYTITLVAFLFEGFLRGHGVWFATWLAWMFPAILLVSLIYPAIQSRLLLRKADRQDVTAMGYIRLRGLSCTVWTVVVVLLIAFLFLHRA